MNKYDLNKFSKFDIQMFAEEADNADENADEGFDISDTTDASSNVGGEPIDKTKAFSDRLNKKTKEIEDKYKKEYEDKLSNVAKLNGFENWDEMEKSHRHNMLENAGVEDVEGFEKKLDELISKNPDVIKAKSIIEQEEKREYDEHIANEIEKINKYDSTIKSLDDISKLDNCNEIIDKLNKGYSLYDAYLISNFDKITENTEENTKYNTLRNIDSKNHMKTTTGSGGNHVNIPQDVLDMYRKNLKGWSDEKIRKHYEKIMKED